MCDDVNGASVNKRGEDLANITAIDWSLHVIHKRDVGRVNIDPRRECCVLYLLTFVGMSLFLFHPSQHNVTRMWCAQKGMVTVDLFRNIFPNGTGYF